MSKTPAKNKPATKQVTAAKVTVKVTPSKSTITKTSKPVAKKETSAKPAAKEHKSNKDGTSRPPLKKAAPKATPKVDEKRVVPAIAEITSAVNRQLSSNASVSSLKTDEKAPSPPKVAKAPAGGSISMDQFLSKIAPPPMPNLNFPFRK